VVALASFHHVELFKTYHIEVKNMQLEIRADHKEQFVFKAVAHTTHGLRLCFLLKLNFKFKFPCESVPNMNLPLIIRDEAVLSRNPDNVIGAMCAVLPVLSDVRDSKVNGGNLVELILEFNFRVNDCGLLLRNDGPLFLNFLPNSLAKKYH